MDVLFWVASSIIWSPPKNGGLVVGYSYNDPLSNVISAPRNIQRISFHQAVWPVEEANSTLQPPDRVWNKKAKTSGKLVPFFKTRISLPSKKIQAICCWRRIWWSTSQKTGGIKVLKWEGTTLTGLSGQFLFGLMLTNKNQASQEFLLGIYLETCSFMRRELEGIILVWILEKINVWKNLHQ